MKYYAYYKVLGWVLLNNIIGKNGQKFLGTGGTDSARYCYSIWMRNLVLLNQISNKKFIPNVVAEIGPGDSLGTGFAALLSGTTKYFALDTVNYSDLSKNLTIFDEIVELFKNREDIPDEEEFPRITQKLDSYKFPGDILSDSHLDAVLSDDRIIQIRQNINSINSDSGSIYYSAPWCDSSNIHENSIDYLFSQAVLEHVDDLDLVYCSMKKWLKKDGIMAHVIDFKSHGTATDWNGHWKYRDITWKIIRGRAPYLINRCPLTSHLNHINQAGFEILQENTSNRNDGITRQKLAERFKEISESDLHVSEAHLICKIHSNST